jgi:hypothetical protein
MDDSEGVTSKERWDRIGGWLDGWLGYNASFVGLE